MAIINFPVLYVPNPTQGKPLFFGKIFVGTEDLDPEIPGNQKQLSIVQEDGTIVPVLQPFILSAGGVPQYNGATVRLSVEGNYSLKILDKNNAQTYYIHNVFEGQPVTVEDQINDLSQAYEFKTVAEYKNSTISFPIGKIIKTLEFSIGRGGGGKYVVIAGTGTANNMNIVANNNTGQSIDLVIGMFLYPAQFGSGQGGADDTGIINHVWTIASAGATIKYPKGQVPITNLVHPFKQLYHEGTGTSSGRSPDDTSGTTLRAIGATNSYMIYMPPPNPLNPAENCRFSSFKDMSCFGNGTLTGLDDDATNNFIKINNQGTNFENFTVRWIKVGIEVNTNTGQKWERMTITCSAISVLFKYDPLTPFNALEISFSTASTYKDISINTSRLNVNAVGWYIDATCAYAQNTLINIDIEACYTGMIVEGRVASKDAVSGSTIAIGAGGFGGAGNNHIGCWFEANNFDVQVVYDAGFNEPAIQWNSLTRTGFLIHGQKSSSWVQGYNSIQAIMPDLLEQGEGSIGDFGAPFTPNQYVISGPKINTPEIKSLIHSRIPLQATDRLTINANSSFEFDAFVQQTPFSTSPLNICNVWLGNSTQSATLEVTAVGTDVAKQHHMTKATYLITNTDDVIASGLVNEIHSGAAQSFHVQGVRTAPNVLGIFVWKDVTVGNVTHTTFNFKLTIGGSNGGGNGAFIQPLI